jgi:MFS family permease
MAVSTGLLGVGYLLGAYVQSALQLYLVVGVLGGLSYPGLLPVPVAVVSRWFDGNRGLALGLTLAGVGVGTLAMPPLIALLVEGYGWRNAFFVLGLLICLICIPPCLLFMRDSEGKRNGSPGEGHLTEVDGVSPGTTGPELSLQEAVGTRAFWLLFFLYGLCIVVLGMIMIHIVPYLTDRGMSPTAAANVLGAIGLGSILGRILVGVLSDRYGTKLVLMACLVTKAIVLLCLPRAGGFLVSYALGFFYGVSYGGFMILIPALTSYLFGLAAMGAIFATISIAEGIGFGVGSYLAGYIWDVTGTYQMMFLIGIVLILVSMLLAAFLKAPAVEET